jgi:hypothetical protein
MEMCPHLIFSLLPDRAKLEKWATELHMTLAIFRDEPLIYLAVLELN